MWSQADLVILVPMLGRPHRVEPLLGSVDKATPDARVLFLTTPNDLQVRAAIDMAGAERLDVEWRHRGDYQNKINTGYRHTTEPMLFTAADDLHFHPGWFEAAVAKLTEGIGVVGTNDLGNPRVLRGVHATHLLITREYVDKYGTIDEPGKVFHEGYWHEYCDDEFVETAWYHEAWAFAEDSHVEHLHPAWGKAPADALYDAQRPRMRQGKALFLQRRPMWCPNRGPGPWT